jgi:uncharacterized protein
MAVLNAIRFPFAIDASGGRLREERSYDAYMVQLIKQVILTGLGERINRPDFGSNTRQMVFGPNNPAAATYGRTLVYQALTTWLEGYIRVEDVQVRAVQETLTVTVEYIVIAQGEKRFLNLELTP